MKEKNTDNSLFFWTRKNNLSKIVRWVSSGLSINEIAENMGVSVDTLYKWSQKNRHIKECIAVGKLQAIENVENALYKKCVGYTVRLAKMVKTKKVTYNDNGQKKSEEEKLAESWEEKYIPPDISAQKFYLATLRNEKWGNAQSGEQIESDGIVVIPDIIESQQEQGEDE